MRVKRLIVSAAAVISVAILATPLAAAAFSPERPTFTCNNAGQCVGADHVQFNSFTNNPAYGDERDFLTIRDADAATTTYANTKQLVDGKEYVVRAYIHNNAQQSLSGPNNYVAKNTMFRVALPTQVKGNAGVSGYISASNATPGIVSDDITLSSNDTMKLDYVAGSAKIRTNGLSDVAISDAVVANGATIGYDKLDGNWPGCFQYSGYVTIHVKATKVTPPVVTPPVTTPTTPNPVTPTATKELPNTGAGDVLGLFAGTSATAGAAHFVISRRRAKS